MKWLHKTPSVLKTLLFVFAVTLVSSSFVFADATADKLNADVKTALDTLAQTQEQITQERIALAQKLSQAEQAVLTKRKELERLEKAIVDAAGGNTDIQRDIASEKESVAYAEASLKTFAQEMEKRLPLDMINANEKELQAAQKDAKGGLSLVSKILGQMKNPFVKGIAATENGSLIEGQFVHVGAMTYFLSNDGSQAGIVHESINAAYPIFAETSGSIKIAEQLKQYVAGTQSSLTFDPSGGKLSEASQEQSLLEHIEKGGIIGYIILALGFLTFSCIVIKWIEISTLRVVTSKQIETALNLLKTKGKDAALAYTETLPKFSADFIATGIKASNEPREILEEFVFAKILQVRPRLERFLAFVSISAAASPLLGLLGTVSGIITTFGVLSVSGSSDPKSLSVGISEALVTTEFGLMVAIPALIFHAILYRMMRRKLGHLEQGMLTLLNGLAQK